MREKGAYQGREAQGAVLFFLAPEFGREEKKGELGPVQFSSGDFS